MYHNNSNEEILNACQIRNFYGKDAKDIAEIIKSIIFKANQEDCLLEKTESFAKNCNTDKILEISSYSRIYVLTLHKKIVACGIISKQFEENSILLTTFVAPYLHGTGVSQKIIKQLVKDESYLHARQIQMVSSITACKFYNKMETVICKEWHHVSA